MSFARNAEIYGENEPAEYLYQLVSGSVRTSKMLNDGRRQIGAFYLPGDTFGLEVGSEHALAAEAITDAKVIVVKRSAVEALAVRDSEVARAVAGRDWPRAAAHAHHTLLLIRSAKERVAGTFCWRWRPALNAMTRSNSRCRGRISPLSGANDRRVSAR